MAIYRWVLQLSNRNCRVFVRHLVFLPTFVTLPFELTRTNYCSAQISALEEDCIKMNKMIISLSPLSPLLWWCQSLMIPLLHMKDKIQPGANKVWSVDMSDMAPGGISNYLRFEPNNENTQFFLFLLYLCITTGISDNFREAFLKRITLFIELQVQHIIYFQTQLCSFIIVNVFSLFVKNMGTSPQSLALRISISIASAAPSSKKQLNHLLSPSAKPSVHCQATYRGGA